MSRGWLDRTLWGLALAVTAAGLLLTVEQAKRWSSASNRLARKDADRTQLLAMAGALRQYEAALEQYDAEVTDEPSNLMPMLGNVVPEPQKLDIRDSVSECGEGWNLWRKEISFGEVPLGKVAEFVSGLVMSFR